MSRMRRWIGIRAMAGILLVGGAACAPGPPAAQNCGFDLTSAQILTDLNASRAANGMGPLIPNTQLACLAQGWSAFLAANNAFFHRNLAAVLSSPGYGGYHTLGENILEGPSSMTAGDMNTAWMNSPDHRANILSPAFSSVGIGVAYANGRVWATEDFGG